MARTDTGGIDRQGVGIAMTAFERLGMAFRPQDIRDFGIDAHVELLTETGASGRLIAVQLKTGPSYFSEATNEGFVFRFDRRHRDYWMSHSLPVIVVLCDTDSSQLYWQRVAQDTVQDTGRGSKVVVPRSLRVNEGGAEQLRDTATDIAAPRSFSILKQEDISHAGAKRYCVRILINHQLSKPEIAAVVRQATLQQLDSQYHRNPSVERLWGTTGAHVVYTFVYLCYDDYTLSNPVCRSWWIDPGLSRDARPLEGAGENVGMSVMMEWFSYHRQLAKVLADGETSKAECLATVDAVVPTLERLARRIEELAVNPPEESATELDRAMTLELAKALQSTAKRLSDSGPAPLECRSLDECAQRLACLGSNMAIPYVDPGRPRWNRAQALGLTRDSIRHFFREAARFHFEREKV